MTGRGSKRPGFDPSTQLSALPSPFARALAFASILLGGLCGGLIGFGVMRLQYPDSTTWKALGALSGAVGVAIAVAVLAVLVLRAMGDWHRPRD